MKAAYGQTLVQYGHMIAGDQSMTQQYADTMQAVSKMTDNVNQVIAQGQASPVPNNHIANVVSSTQPKWLPGDKMIEVNGTLVNERTGEAMF